MSKKDNIFKDLNKIFSETFDFEKFKSEMQDLTKELNSDSKPLTSKLFNLETFLDPKPVYKFALREDLKDKKEFLPTRAHDTDTGWDVAAAMVDHKSVTLKRGEKILMPLGFRVFCPSGWWLKLVPRSSSFAKKDLHFLYGTIDESYPGEVKAAFQYLPPSNHDGISYDEITINFGDKIAQLIPIKREDMSVEDISNEEIDKLYNERAAKRSGGFGSTG